MPVQPNWREGAAPSGVRSGGDAHGAPDGRSGERPLHPAAAHGAPEAGPLVAWLAGQALPLWAGIGTDRRLGGYVERIDLDGRPVEEPRRTRVVARQIYVFAAAARHGWLPGAQALVDHGLAFLRERLRLPSGLYATAVHADGRPHRPEFQLYEHAFVLFALAAAAAGRTDHTVPALQAEAAALLRRMRVDYAHPQGGFEEAAPRSLPLRSNPHMHLLEAALAWAAVCSGEQRRPWLALADELVALCLSRFIDADSGALGEHFDGDWRPMPDAAGQVVEPGHQFEWAWLLMRWSALRAGDHGASAGASPGEAPAGITPGTGAAGITPGTGAAGITPGTGAAGITPGTVAAGITPAGATAAAARLLHIGERHGVDPRRGVAVDALDHRLHVAAATAKLWPQTERSKAWHAAALSATDPEARAQAEACRAAAVRGLAQYLLDSPAGLWHEQMAPDGRYARQPCRASSLYHIVCAIETLADGTGP